LNKVYLGVLFELRKLVAPFWSQFEGAESQFPNLYHNLPAHGS